MTPVGERERALDNPLVRELRSALLEAAEGDVAAAFDDAVLWIVEIELHRRKISPLVSAGFVRRKIDEE